MTAPADPTKDWLARFRAWWKPEIRVTDVLIDRIDGRLVSWAEAEIEGRKAFTSLDLHRWAWADTGDRLPVRLAKRANRLAVLKGNLGRRSDD
ncbi:MAG: hypothetical protein NXI30_04605 [bacterium]|nr:hypothetical protein [bacterium]